MLPCRLKEIGIETFIAMTQQLLVDMLAMSQDVEYYLTSMFTFLMFHRSNTVHVISVVAVGSGAAERAPQAAADPGPSCCTAPGHCCGTGDHQGSTGPSAATEGQQGSATHTLLTRLRHITLKKLTTL